MSNIHPTAIIDEQASIGNNVTIGAYCVIEGNVTLADNVELKSHVVVVGNTTVGEGTVIYPFASIGHRPQDLKFKGEPSRLVIGKNNVIREYATMNPGTESGGMLTEIGDNCLFMINSHVAHDCKVGNHVIVSHASGLAGHVQVDDYAIIGGASAIHQFVRIGTHAMVGGMSAIENDVIPYGSAMGERASLAGLNLIGLKRRGFDRKDIHALRNAYKDLFASGEGTMAEKIATLKEKYADSEAVAELLEFLAEEGGRKICLPKHC